MGGGGNESGDGEALVVCSERSMGTGITVWGLSTGDHLLHIPTCASIPHAMLCLSFTNTNSSYDHHFLFASQIHRHGSLGGGSIFTWSFNKPQTPLRSYPLEAIGPLSCTKDGVYLSGGALSGNAYLWEVASGKLLKSWRAHHRCLTCMLFSDDSSLLVSGSEDGLICVWSMISLLDVEGSGISSPLLHCSSEHSSSITGMSTPSGSSSPMLVSSSLDGTCKVMDLVLGRVMQTVVCPLGITASVLHRIKQLVFFGSLDGRIFINSLDIGLIEGPSSSVSKDQPVVLQGHNGAITALAFGRTGLVSASEDCTVCVWDDIHWTVTRKFNHQKGPVTNLVLVPRSSLSSGTSNRRASNAFRISPLDKSPQPANSFKETITFLPITRSSIGSTDSCKQTLDTQLQKEWTPEAMKMRAETSLEARMWAMKMAKHVMEINRHLQSRLLDLMQSRLLWSKETNSTKAKKREKLMVETTCDNNNSPILQNEDQPKSP